MAKTRNGFLPFGSLDEDILVRAALKTADNTENGYSFAVGQSGANLNTDFSYTDAGVALVGSVPPMRWVLSPLTNGAFLTQHGSYQCDIEVGYIGNVPSATKYAVTTTRGWLQQTNAGVISQNWNVPTAPNSNALTLSQVGKGTHFNFQVHYQGGYEIVFVDYLPVAVKHLRTQTGSITDVYVHGLTTVANSGHTNIRIKNLQLSTRPQRFPVSGSFLLLGDSITCMGNSTANQIGGNHVLSWEPGYGFQSDGVTSYGSGAYFDVGLIPTMVRELSKKGVWTNDNVNIAQSGGSVSHAITQLNTWMAANKGKVPKVVICNLGTNNIAGGQDIASAKTEYESLLTTIYNLGVQHVACWTPPSLRNATTYQTAAYDTKHVDFNAIVETSNPAYCTAQGFRSDFYRVIPAFAEMGGHNFDVTEYETANNIHPTIKGHLHLGQIIASHTYDLYR